MRILLASEFYFPSVGGAQEVVRQIARGLVARGHDVTVATSRLPRRTALEHEGVTIREFAVTGNAARGMSGDIAEYVDFVRTGGFDAFLTYAAQQWTTDAILPALDALPTRAYLAPCGFSGLHRKQYADYFLRLPIALHQFDGLIFHSGTYQDIEFALRHGCTALHVVPNGADQHEFDGDPVDRERVLHSLGVNADHQLVITIGSHTGVKGHSEAMEIFRRSKQLRDSTLLIAANSLGGRGCRQTCPAHMKAMNAVKRDRRVLIRDLPRDQVVAALQAADLMVMASLIECSPLVLFEAAAAGTPFVANDVGNSREIAEWTGAGITVAPRRRTSIVTHPSLRGMTSAVDRLLESPSRMRQMADAGRAAFTQRFNWGYLVGEYERILSGDRVGG